MATATYTSYVEDNPTDGRWDGSGADRVITVTEIGGSEEGVYELGESVEVTFSPGGTIFNMTYEGVDNVTGNPIFSEIIDPSTTATLEFSATDITSLQGTDYTVNTVDSSICFMAGTMVTTPEGTKAVEELSINDTVMTSEGEVSKVKFVSIQTMDKFTIPDNRLPVCIRQDALAPNVPNKDLYVSSDHAMYVDGILAHAGALVNDISIKRVERSELEQSFTYYHVELEDHSLILADNAPAETFVDNVTRAKFHNYKEYIELYGENENENLTGELELPRAMSKRQLPKAIKERLEERALALFSDELSHTA